jgi:hypothetical protein
MLFEKPEGGLEYPGLGKVLDQALRLRAKQFAGRWATNLVLWQDELREFPELEPEVRILKAWLLKRRPSLEKFYLEQVTPHESGEPGQAWLQIMDAKDNQIGESIDLCQVQGAGGFAILLAQNLYKHHGDKVFRQAAGSKRAWKVLVYSNGGEEGPETWKYDPSESMLLGDVGVMTRMMPGQSEVGEVSLTLAKLYEWPETKDLRRRRAETEERLLDEWRAALTGQPVPGA